MAIEAVDNLTPDQATASSAFDKVNSFYPEYTRESLAELSPEDREMLVLHYVGAAFSYLSNHSNDQYLARMAEIDWQGLRREITKKYPFTTHEGIDELDISELEKNTYRRKYGANDPAFITDVGFVGLGYGYTGTFIVPATFVLAAREDPVGSMVKFARELARMTDFLTNKFMTQTVFMDDQRANATGAHMARVALQEIPDARIGLQGANLVRRFPNGLTPSMRNPRVR